MKILQVIDKLAVGGAERVAVDLSILLSKNSENEVAFLCLLAPSVLDKELVNENIPITYLHRKNKYNPFTIFKLLRLLNGYDIVHVHSRHVLRYVGLTYLPFFKRQFKLVFHDHFGTIDSNTSISKYLKFCLSNLSAYIGVSQSLTTWAKENAVNDTIYLLKNIARKATIVKAIATKSDVVIIGNFRPQKNYAFLCELLATLPKNISVDLYGNIVDKAYHNKIVQMKDALLLKDNLRMIHTENNTTPLLNNYKLALHCAASETGPLVAIEYLSEGLPLLMYKTGEVAVTIAKYDDSLLMNDFNTANWKEKIELLLDNEHLRAEKSKLAATIYKENYSEEKYSEQCQKIYQHIINF